MYAVISLIYFIADIGGAYILSDRAIGLMSRVIAYGPWDRGSIQGRVIPKTQKVVLYVALLNTQHRKVRIKGKVEQSRQRSSALPYTSVL